MRAALKAFTITLITCEGATLACPPSPPPSAEGAAEWDRRIQSFKKHAVEAPAIVYGVMEDSLGYDKKRRDRNRVGTLRIIHVYKGRYRSGQRIKVRPGSHLLATCPMPPMSIGRGSYGVVILDKTLGGKSMRHNGFLSPDLIRLLMADGIIRSARDAEGMVLDKAGP
jgi:hypothetical protein